MTPAPEPQKPEVRFEAMWSPEVTLRMQQRIQPIVDEVVRIIINIGSTNHFETRIVADLKSLNKDIDKTSLRDKALWDGRAVEIKNAAGKLLCTITPASLPSEMSSPPVREARVPNTARPEPQKDDHSSGSDSSKGPLWGSLLSVF